MEDNKKGNIGTDIQFAANLLKNGHLVAIPTETVYGLAANAFDPIAVAGIFEAKKRPHFDPLIVHASSIDFIERQIVSEFPAKAKLLAEKCWPGPLTLILPKSSNIPDLVTSGKNTVGVRIPNQEQSLALLRQLDFPLAAPSANPFGYISPTKAQHVADQLGEEVPYIIDGGDCEIGIESTIVGFEGNQILVYRLGGLSVEELEHHLGEKVEVIKDSEENPSAPGMLKSHYAPRKQLLLFENITDDIIRKYGNKCGYLLFNKNLDNIPKNKQIILSQKGDVKEAAAKLFSALRSLDSTDVEMIIAEKMPETGLGFAINDRLKRASFVA